MTMLHVCELIDDRRRRVVVVVVVVVDKERGVHTMAPQPVQNIMWWLEVGWRAGARAAGSWLAWLASSEQHQQSTNMAACHSMYTYTVRVPYSTRVAVATGMFVCIHQRPSQNTIQALTTALSKCFESKISMYVPRWGFIFIFRTI